MYDAISPKWLASLVNGEEWTAVVPYPHRQVGGRVVQVKIVRRTSTQLVAMIGREEARFRITNGVKVGDRWEKIPTPASDEVVAAARRENRRLKMASRLKEIDFQQLPYEKLEAVLAILQPQGHDSENGSVRASSV